MFAVSIYALLVKGQCSTSLVAFNCHIQQYNKTKQMDMQIYICITHSPKQLWDHL